MVNYHRVAQPEAAAAFDEGVLDATPDTLDRQIALLKRYFTLVGLEDVLASVRGRTLPANPALITFDDGYRDVHDAALPILERHGVRAAFFIATHYVEARRVFWWDRISWTLKHAGRRRFILSYPEPTEIDLERGTGPSERRLARIVKDRYALDLERFLRELTDMAAAEWDDGVEARLANQLVMTWDQVRALRRAGMDIGSHTRTHRVMQTLTPEELDQELRGSRRELERQLGEPVVVIAYPVGRSIAGNPAIRGAVVAAGYELGFTYDSGIQSLRSPDPYDMRRLSAEHTMDDARFRALLAMPFLGR